MKHLKTFENIKKKYKMDDYILIKNGILIDKYKLGKIVGFFIDGSYDIKFPDGWTTDIPERFIKRLLTKEEIDQYKTEKIAKKYNI